jgi:retron-type reverse transcriptase
MNNGQPEALFAELSSIEDIATLLRSSPEQLKFILYARPVSQRYYTFTISKRRGGTRQINAPKPELKAIQRTLSEFLQDRITVRESVHGFVRGRSIVTNARLHVRHRTVFNVDIKDFFPSINFGRVRGLFMAKPFSASQKVATILAQICCHDGSLPQGAPTSPIISNLICWRLDAELQRLAKQHNCVFSRYADDITFSKRQLSLPSEIVGNNAHGEAVPGVELRRIIIKNGFQLHPEKVSLQRDANRKTVTGLVVNSRVNVPREFVRGIRAIIHDWRVHGRAAAEARHHSLFYRRAAKAGPLPRIERILEGKLNFLKMVRGVDDPVRRNLQRQFLRVWPDYLAVIEKEAATLTTRDLFICHASHDKASFVREFASALRMEAIRIWYDEYELTIGDQIYSKINEGLSSSRYGVVVVSQAFLNARTTWPSAELAALLALQDADRKPRILPVWLGVDQAYVVSRAPILATRFAWKADDFTIQDLATKFRKFLDGTEITQ